jgi:hypothetical protein
MCGYGLDSSDSRYDPAVGSYKHSNESLGFIKDREFDQLSDCQVIKEPTIWRWLILKRVTHNSDYNC